MQFGLKINGIFRNVDCPVSSTLLSAIRNDLGLTGTRYGCGHGVCGACCVLIDGKSVASCTLTVDEAIGKEITTVEGLATNGELHCVQKAFLEEDAMQCGYCTSGMLISAVALLKQKPYPSDEEIRDALSLHLCRCGIYLRVICAVKRAIR